MPTADLKRGHGVPFLLDIIRLEVVNSEHIRSRANLNTNNVQICRKSGGENVFLEPSSIAVLMAKQATTFARFELEFEKICQFILNNLERWSIVS